MLVHQDEWVVGGSKEGGKGGERVGFVPEQIKRASQGDGRVSRWKHNRGWQSLGRLLPTVLLC